VTGRGFYTRHKLAMLTKPLPPPSPGKESHYPRLSFYANGDRVLSVRLQMYIPDYQAFIGVPSRSRVYI
jgi:hypothetical protein